MDYKNILIKIFYLSFTVFISTYFVYKIDGLRRENYIIILAISLLLYSAIFSISITNKKKENFRVWKTSSTNAYKPSPFPFQQPSQPKESEKPSQQKVSEKSKKSEKASQQKISEKPKVFEQAKTSKQPSEVNEFVFSAQPKEPRPSLKPFKPGQSSKQSSKKQSTQQSTKQFKSTQSSQSSLEKRGSVDVGRVDCKVTDWRDVSECSKPCGGGTKMQRRDRTDGVNGGRDDCPRDFERKVACNENPCPIDCVLSDWGGNFVSKELMTPDFYKKFTSFPTDKVLKLDGWTLRSNVDIEMGESLAGIFTDPTKDPPSFGVNKLYPLMTGFKSKRAILLIEAPNPIEVSEIKVHLGEIIAFNETKRKKIVVRAWNGNIAGWDQYGNSPSNAVLIGEYIHLIKNIVTLATNTKVPYQNWKFEFEAYLPFEDSVKIKTIRLIGKTTLPDVDEEGFSKCTKACGGGTKRRIRTVKVQPQYGGKKCNEPLVETRNCNTHSCTSDCILGDWVNEGDCSKPCGGGTIMQIQQIKQEAVNKNSCPSLRDRTRKIPCNTQPCPVDCVLGNWENVGECSKRCGGGKMKQTKKIISYPTNGGKQCQSDLNREIPCNEDKCPECVVSEWTPFGNCSKFCGGGVKKRTREYIRGDKNNCPPLMELVPCNTKPCNQEEGCITEECMYGCKVSSWGDFTECSKKCEGGVKKRTRRILRNPLRSKFKCPPLEETIECNKKPCVTDCVVTDWSDYSKCTKTCGGGTMTRKRKIKIHPKNVNNCPPLENTISCNRQPCPSDCVVSRWSDWDKCSVTCGGGTRKRIRQVISNQSNGGKDCPPLSEVEPCNTKACDNNCYVSDWSKWSPCSEECEGGITIRTRRIEKDAIKDGKLCPPLVDIKKCNDRSCKQRERKPVGNKNIVISKRGVLPTNKEVMYFKRSLIKSANALNKKFNDDGKPVFLLMKGVNAPEPLFNLIDKKIIYNNQQDFRKIYENTGIKLPKKDKPKEEALVGKVSSYVPDEYKVPANIPSMIPKVVKKVKQEEQKLRIIKPRVISEEVKLRRKVKIPQEEIFKINNAKINKDVFPIERKVDKIVERKDNKVVEDKRVAPVDKIVEKKVDKVVERKVDKVVEDKKVSPVDKVVERNVNKVVEKKVDKVVEDKRVAPVDKVVEKKVDKVVEDKRVAPVDKVVKKKVDKVVEPVQRKSDNSGVRARKFSGKFREGFGEDRLYEVGVNGLVNDFKAILGIFQGKL